MSRGAGLLRTIFLLAALSSVAVMVGLVAYSHYAPSPSPAPEAAVSRTELADMNVMKVELERELDTAQDRVRNLERENRLLKGASERFEEEKAVILDQVRDSISGFADYKEETSSEITELSGKITELETEKEKLSEALASVSAEAEDNNALLVSQIHELNRIIDRHKADVGRLKDLMQAKEKQEIVIEAAKLHYNLGNFYFRNQQYDLAADEYRKSLLYRPDDSDTHFNLAVVLDEHLDLHREAINHYKHYLALNPGGEDTLKIENRILDLELRESSLTGNTLAQKS